MTQQRLKQTSSPERQENESAVLGSLNGRLRSGVPPLESIVCVIEEEVARGH
jgi:hypothetical protein